MSCFLSRCRLGGGQVWWNRRRSSRLFHFFAYIFCCIFLFTVYCHIFLLHRRILLSEVNLPTYSQPNPAFQLQDYDFNCPRSRLSEKRKRKGHLTSLRCTAQPPPSPPLPSLNPCLFLSLLSQHSSRTPYLPPQSLPQRAVLAAGAEGRARRGGPHGREGGEGGRGFVMWLVGVLSGGGSCSGAEGRK